MLIKYLTELKLKLEKQNEQSKLQLSFRWNWLCSQLLDLLDQYPGGLTETIVMCEIMNSYQKESRLSNGDVHQIDCIYDSKYLMYSEILEVTIKKIDGNIAVLTDGKSFRCVDMYLHQRLNWLLLNVPHSKELCLNAKFRFTGGRVAETYRKHSSHDLCLLPTNHMVLILDDQNPQDKIFIQRNFTSFHRQSQNGGNFILQVVEIFPPKSITVLGHSQAQIIQLQDPETLVPISFLLWDDQIMLSSLFSIGDNIGIYRPFVDVVQSYGDEMNNIFSSFNITSPYIEYGSATVLFLIVSPTNESQLMDISQSHMISRRDKRGYCDMQHIPQRLMISDLKPKFINVGLYVSILNVSSCRTSQPLCSEFLNDFCKGKLNQDTFVLTLRVGDESGSMDIELIGKCADQAIDYQRGHCCSIEAVYVFAYDGKLVGVCIDSTMVLGAQCKLVSGKLRNINRIISLLRTDIFVRPTLLRNLLHSREMLDPIICRGIITKAMWTKRQQEQLIYQQSAESTIYVHCRCFEEAIPCHQGEWKCEKCLLRWTGSQEGVLAYADLVVIIEDGSTSIGVVCTQYVIDTLFGLSASQYDLLDIRQKYQYLNALKDAEYNMLLTRCPPHTVVGTQSHQKLPIHFQVDQLLHSNGIVVSELHNRVVNHQHTS